MALEIAQFIGRSDNFCVLVHDPASGATAAIDAPDSDAIAKVLESRGWRLTHILVTHKHLDHIEGIPALKEAYSAEVIGPAASAAETGLYDRTVSEGDRFTFGGTPVEVIGTPGHTLDHVTYYLPEEKLAFAGDTIFAMGCGRVIEGTPEMMWASLLKLRALPPDTTVYCGHEYTLANARFAATVDPSNTEVSERLREVERLRENGEVTLPTTIAREIATNPFLRADSPLVMAAVDMNGADPAAVFAEIRRRKDRF
ncbi:hydroxyacylglutathione hydrolase [Propylenella binzhouense]|uniref:Hydroxyacylglutathione hydrolase n=1 Tax=Propylenella binzhouense TaxID=2555902 RepID=A0A964T614_9HYPH|nr:hydroxyacylglutathione hydrolase [Propylenella binzhouense]MYZ49186.1 hydroxyacylglutathione hydrolase [Propylenella binzhouense]